MSVITVPISKFWHVRLPVLVRYLEREWVDRFFDTGEIMISSFARFRKHTDEQRHDPHEGAATLDMRFGDQPLTGIGFFGGDAYVLSASTIEGNDLQRQFGGYDSRFRITDSVGFAAAIANLVPGFSFGFQGHCMYRSERTVRRAVDGPPLMSEPPATQEEGERLFHDMNRRVFEAANFEPFLMKPLKYAHQGEYRLIWCVQGPEQDRLIVMCPDARRFCERAD